MSPDHQRDALEERQRTLERELQDPEVLRDPKRLAAASRAHAEVIASLEELRTIATCDRRIAGARETMTTSTDTELRALANIELEELAQKRSRALAHLQELLEPKDPLNERDVVMEIRPGVGGDEAELFAAELFRMYARYAERRGWRTRLATMTRTPIGGCREATFTIEGGHVYRDLRYEGGVHRVQRVPATEKNGRIHTSTVTVAVLPKAAELDVHIDPKDLRIETFLSGGHGGQSVQTTYSAVRITHLPSGLVVSCQDERSQQQNRERALEVLRSRLWQRERERRAAERTAARRAQTGSGARSEKVRTYHFGQDRVTDHRVEHDWHNLRGILDGDLVAMINAVREHFGRSIGDESA